MVTNRNAEGVLDPRLLEKPSSRALKRALLVALRCVDPNAQKRPKMGHVIHMLEADEFPFRDVSTVIFVPYYSLPLHFSVHVNEAIPWLKIPPSLFPWYSLCACNLEQ